MNGKTVEFKRDKNMPFSPMRLLKHGAVFPQNNTNRSKTLKKENLRDHMSNLELVLNMLAEATTTEISKEKNPKTFEDSRKIAKQGGTIAGNTRKEIEEKTGKKVVIKLNAKQIEQKKNKEIDEK